MSKKNIFTFGAVTVVYAVLIVLIYIKSEDTSDIKSEDYMLNYLCDFKIYNKNKDKKYSHYLKELKKLNSPFSTEVLDVLGLISRQEKKSAELNEDRKKDIEILAAVINNSSINGTELLQILDTFKISDLKIKIALWKGIENSGWINRDSIAANKHIYKYIKELSISLFQLGFQEYALSGLKELSKIKTATGYDPEVYAWYGSSLTKRALFTQNNVQKIDFVKEGIKYLDQAVFEFPDYAIVRYIRANTYNSLPQIFNKNKMLKEDIIFLIDAYKNHTLLKGRKSLNETTDVNIDINQLLIILEGAKKVFTNDLEFLNIINDTYTEIEGRR